MYRIAAPLLLGVLAVAGCRTESTNEKAPAVVAAEETAAPVAQAPTGNWKAIPNIQGLLAEVQPDNKLVPNSEGGAAGFHAQDDSAMLLLNEVAGEDLQETMEQAKEGTFLAKAWLKTQATPDGWILTYSIPKFDESGEEEVGLQYAFSVRRKIGQTTYNCYGTTAQKEALDAMVKVCQSIKTK